MKGITGWAIDFKTNGKEAILKWVWGCLQHPHTFKPFGL
jgi:hypothetical protein